MDTPDEQPAFIEIRQIARSGLSVEQAQRVHDLLMLTTAAINAAVPLLECGLITCDNEGHNHEVEGDPVRDLRRLLPPQHDTKALSDYAAYQMRWGQNQEQSREALEQGRGDPTYHTQRLTEPMLTFTDWYKRHVIPGTPPPANIYANTDPLTHLRAVTLVQLRTAGRSTLAHQLEHQATLGTDPQLLVDIGTAALQKD